MASRTSSSRARSTAIAGRRVATAVVVTGLLFALARPVAAHQAGTRFDAPIPQGLLLLGAAATVAFTALLLVATGETPTGRRRLVSISAPVGDAACLLARTGFLVVVVAALVDGVTGPAAAGENLATVFVWPVWVKGLALLSVLAGSPWRALAPWRTVYDGLSRLEGGDLALRPYPARLGVWPAVAGFVLLVGFVENLTVAPRQPAVTAAVVAGYAIVMLVGGVVFGPVWFEKADPLAVLYGVLGRAAPLVVERDDEWVVSARVPWRDCVEAVDRGLATFVVAMVYTVSFDGMVESAAFVTATTLVDAGVYSGVVLYVLGLVGFLVGYVAVVTLAGSLGSIHHPVNAFAASVVPIAAAYEVAHNYGFALTFLGRLPQFVGASVVDPLFWLSVPAFWATQVVLVVLGHVVAVVAGHVVVATRVDGRRRTLLAHAPLVGLMVGYTVLSLWILSTG